MCVGVELAHFLSPLRYPGSKRRMAERIVSFVARYDFDTFIEPFAGGAYIGLVLLRSGLAKKLVIGDKDELVAAFWEALFFHTDDLIDLIERTPIDVPTWMKIRDSQPTSLIDKAFKCLYLNRTSYSGVLKGGVLGGYEQKSRYKIDCRFDRPKIVKRIQELVKLRDMVEVYHCSYEDLAKKSFTKPFFYFDPPYYQKGNLLYNHYFKPHDHIRLRNFLATLEAGWLLSYDYHPKIEELYEGYHIARYTSYHSATKRSQRPKKMELLIAKTPLF